MSDVPHWTEFPKHRPPCWHSDFRGLSLLVYPNPTYDWVWEVSRPPPENGTLGKGPAKNLDQAMDRAGHFAYGWNALERRLQREREDG
jgi:hypothetical protein